MVWSIARSRSPRFDLGGSVSCGTPYGLFQVPLELSVGAVARAD
jgi:hypothetical protein